MSFKKKFNYFSSFKYCIIIKIILIHKQWLRVQGTAYAVHVNNYLFHFFTHKVIVTIKLKTYYFSHNTVSNIILKLREKVKIFVLKRPKNVHQRWKSKNEGFTRHCHMSIWCRWNHYRSQTSKLKLNFCLDCKLIKGK